MEIYPTWKEGIVRKKGQSLNADDAVPRLRGSVHRAAVERIGRLRPLCADCLKRGIIELGKELDHIVPLFRGAAAGGTNDDGNLQLLCESCHRIKTAADKGHKYKGIDAAGFPIDNRHPWVRLSDLKRSTV